MPRVPGDDLVGIVGQLKAADVRSNNHRGGGEVLADPVDEATPMGGPDQDDGYPHGVAALVEGKHLEHFVDRAKSAGEQHKRCRVTGEHQLADEEVPEPQWYVDVGVELLLDRQLDVEPH